MTPETVLRKALKAILSRLSGIESDDLTTAEKQIQVIAKAALGRRTTVGRLRVWLI